MTTDLRRAARNEAVTGAQPDPELVAVVGTIRTGPPVPPYVDGNRGALVAAEQPDPVEHPTHYTSSPARCTCGRTIECIDVAQHLTFNRGNVIKYVWRAGAKGDVAKEIEDLRKARQYLEFELTRLAAQGALVDPRAV